MRELPADEVALLTGAAAEMRGHRVVLAGSGGFLGRWLTAALRPICDLQTLDLTEGFDITDAAAVARLDPPVFVIHAAGHASPWAYRAQPLGTIAGAIDGTRNLLELSRAYGARMLFFSSSEIYGNPTIVPTPEWDNGNVSCRGPRACYDESKRLAETLCEVYHELYETRVVTVRPFNAYGPGMALDDGRAVPAFTRRIVNSEPIAVHGDGNQTRTYCYVTDALRGCLAALQYGQAGRVYNIGTAEPEISATGLATLLCDLTGSPVPVYSSGGYPSDYPGDEPRRRCPDLNRARGELGYEPAVALDDGLRRYLRWAGVL